MDIVDGDLSEDDEVADLNRAIEASLKDAQALHDHTYSDEVKDHVRRLQLSLRDDLKESRVIVLRKNILSSAVRATRHESFSFLASLGLTSLAKKQKTLEGLQENFSGNVQMKWTRIWRLYVLKCGIIFVKI